MFGWFKKSARGADDDLDTNRAAECMRRGDYTEALRRVEVMLAKGPEIALSWRVKGECLFYLDRYAEAIDAFQRAIEIGSPGTEELFFGNPWRFTTAVNANKQNKSFVTLSRGAQLILNSRKRQREHWPGSKAGPNKPLHPTTATLVRCGKLVGVAGELGR